MNKTQNSGFQKHRIPVVSIMDAYKHLEAGRAYEFFGLHERALEEYSSVPPESEHYPVTQAQWVGAMLSLGRYREAQDRGLAILQTGRTDNNLVLNTSLALHLDHQFAAALDLLLQNRHVLNPFEAASHIGCAAARCANWEWADKAFIHRLSSEEGPSKRFFLDLDVEPWIEHLIKDPLSTEAIESLSNPRIKDNYLAMTPPEHPIPVDALLLDAMPNAFRSCLIVVPKSGFYEWDPNSPRRLRSRYLTWQRTRFQRNQARFDEAVGRAKAVLLDLQLDRAVKHARSGNFLAARHHTLFALTQDLRRFQSFEQVLRPLGMGYLLDDLLRACFKDTAILRKFDSIDQRLANQATSPRTLLEEMEEWPPCILETGMALIVHGRLHLALKQTDEELAFWLALARRWPADPVGPHNAAKILAKRGDWDFAAALMESLPEGSHGIPSVVSLTKQIAEHCISNNSFIPHGPFYGQSDLGGTLHSEDQSLPWFF